MLALERIFESKNIYFIKMNTKTLKDLNKGKQMEHYFESSHKNFLVISITTNQLQLILS